VFKKIFILIFLCTNSLFSQQFGVNISLPERGGTFVDLAKEEYRWVDLTTGEDLQQHQVDSRGWPICNARYITDWRPVAEWTGTIDDPEQYRIDMTGTYKCSFMGHASINPLMGGSIQNKIYSPGQNKTTFDFVVTGLPKENYQIFVLDFNTTYRSASDTAGSGITDFKMIRPGYDANTTQTFTDDFINALRAGGFAAIRFMNFTRTNSAEPEYPAVTEWSDRKQTTDASQQRMSAIDKLDGAAWEYVIEMLNLNVGDEELPKYLESDAWINVPVSATTDYVTQLATLLRDNLNSHVNIYVESSNEVWNTHPEFNQSYWNIAQAQALGLTEHENHARRTIELAQIFESVFGTGSLNNRIRVMLCSHQPMLKWWVEPMLQYINTNFGPPKDYIYAIACQTYFTGGNDAGEDVTKILDDCHLDITNQIDETGETNEAGRMQWVAKAAAWELPGGFCSYEGGPNHFFWGATDNIANIIAAERSERMADEFKYNYDDAFFKLGGNLVMHFVLSSGYQRYGCLGLTDDISNLYRNYKFQAALDLIDTYTNVKTHNKTLPEEYNLFQNYPNPFNPETTIKYRLFKAGKVEISIYNVLGQRVRTLINNYLNKGNYSVKWNGKNDSGNIPRAGYIVKMKTKNFLKTRKILYLR